MYDINEAMKSKNRICCEYREQVGELKMNLAKLLYKG